MESPAIHSRGASPAYSVSRSPGHVGHDPMEEQGVEVLNQDGQDVGLTVLEMNDDGMKFQAHSMQSSFANALRRVMLAEVPILAVDVVEVLRNDSVLHDEMLVHRIGLVPLQTIIDTADGRRYNVAEALQYPRDCECMSHCAKCSVTFEIKVRCLQSTRQTVTSHDMVNVTQHDLHSQVAPVHTPHSNDSYPIVIVELARGQEISVRCVARKGIAKEHARWSPVCTVAMQFIPEIQLNEAAFNEVGASHKKAWVNYCPRKVFVYDKEQNRVEVNPETVNKCFFCDECMTIQEEPFKSFRGRRQLVSVRRKKDDAGRYEFLFTIETTGCMKPQELLAQAVQVLRAKIFDAFECMKNKMTKEGRDGELLLDGTRSQSSRAGSMSGTPPSGPSAPSASGGLESPYYSEVMSAVPSGAASDIPWE